MKFVDLKAVSRDTTGKESSKKIRDEGLVPGILYKKGKEGTKISIDKKELYKALHTDLGQNAILRVIIEGGKKKDGHNVVIKEVQRHPTKDYVIHIDLHEILLTEKITVNVPVKDKGEPIGVKEGGVLEHILWELEIETLPTSIPEKIEVDVSALKIEESIQVKDIMVDEGIKILNDPEEVVFLVEQAKSVEDLTAVSEEETQAEPEMIKEKKEKPEEGAPSEEPKGEKV